VFDCISKHYVIPLIDMHEGPKSLVAELTTPDVTDTHKEGIQVSTEHSLMEMLSSDSISAATRNADATQGIILIVVAIAIVLVVVCTLYSPGATGSGDRIMRPKVVRSTSAVSSKWGREVSRPLPSSRGGSDPGDGGSIAGSLSSQSGSPMTLMSGNLSSKQVLSPTSPSTTVGQLVDTAPICPTFVVKQPEGLAIEVPLELQPTEQRFKLLIKDIASGDVVARAYVSDRPEEPGIMLETADGSSVAFLLTKFALVGPGGQNPANRVAVLYRAQHGGWNTAGTPYAVFSMTKDYAGGSTVVGWRGGVSTHRPPFLKATIDPNGRLMILEDEHMRELAIGLDVPSREAPVAAIRVHQGGDAGMALIVLFAAAKLS